MSVHRRELLRVDVDAADRRRLRDVLAALLADGRLELPVAAVDRRRAVSGLLLAAAAVSSTASVVAGAAAWSAPGRASGLGRRGDRLLAGRRRRHATVVA